MEELIELRGKYKRILDDYDLCYRPVEMTTKEINELEGYKKALNMMVSDLGYIIEHLRKRGI